MTTLKGFVRSYSAAVKRAERERGKRLREAAKRLKEQQKQVEILEAANAVEVYQEYIRAIQSLHQEDPERLDWDMIIKEEKPSKPQRGNHNQNLAEEKLKNFRPGLIHKFIGSKRKSQKLSSQIELGKQRDESEFIENLKKYQVEVEKWEKMQLFSSGVKDQDPKIYKDILQYFSPFSEIELLGTEVALEINAKSVTVRFKANDESVIPSYTLTQLKSGKLSKKNMTKSKFFELYQDHICSAALRIGNEIFALIPVIYVKVCAIREILNTSTGFSEPNPVLSVLFTQKGIEALNLARIDPSDSLANFVHTMKFKKTTGFQKVEEVQIPENN